MISRYIQALQPNTFYHIYNKAHENQKLFYDNEDYKRFLITLNKYLNKSVEFYSFCLIPNHFHLLIKTMQTEKSYSKSFSDLFNSYARYLQVRHDLTGNIFNRPFKRLPITDNNYFMQAVYYIHSNPTHHKIMEDFKKYNWSSYNLIMDKKKSALKKDELLEIFGGIDNYISFHNDLTEINADKVGIEL